MEKRIQLSTDFKTDTPVLPNVKLIETWGYYDGPLFGVCEANGQQLFFIDVIFDILRYYEDDTHERLWSIFGVYDISLKAANSIIDSGTMRLKWQHEIEETSDCVGIFWKYES